MSVENTLAKLDALIASVDDRWQCGCGTLHERASILARGVCHTCGRRPEAWDVPQPAG